MFCSLHFSVDLIGLKIKTNSHSSISPHCRFIFLKNRVLKTVACQGLIAFLGWSSLPRLRAPAASRAFNCTAPLLPGVLFANILNASNTLCLLELPTVNLLFVLIAFISPEHDNFETSNLYLSFQTRLKCHLHLDFLDSPGSPSLSLLGALGTPRAFHL